jgi:hypothetical protein
VELRCAVSVVRAWKAVIPSRAVLVLGVWPRDRSHDGPGALPRLNHSPRLASSNVITRSTLPLASKMRISPVRSRARGFRIADCLIFLKKHGFNAGGFKDAPTLLARLYFNCCHHQGALKPLIRAGSSQVQGMLTAVHLTERRTSYRCRGVRQRSKSFVLRVQSLRRSPGFAELVCITQYRSRSAGG